MTSKLLCPEEARAESRETSAGWSQVEITPPLGIALGGRGGSLTASKEILDPLSAHLLYVRDEKGIGFVLVSFDLVGIPHSLSDRIRQSLVHELGVEWNLAILNCSHTHSGPHMIRDILAASEPAPQIEVDYFKALEEKIVQTARQAAKNIKPVRVEVFEGSSDVAINRRGKNKKGERAIIPDPKGPIDEKVWVMKLTPKDDSAPAIVFSYACHPVIVYGYAHAAISADFPGVARRVICENLGEQTHVQYVQGLAGNVRPRVVADLENNRFRPSRAADTQSAGKELADDVLAALNSKGKLLKLNLAGATDNPFLQRGAPPSRDIYETMAKEKNSYLRSVGEYWLKRYDTGEGFAKGDAWPVGLIRLAENQWVVYFAGEPCVEWRDKISKWLRKKDIVPWGYCQEANTYLPTEELLPEGGYEVLECNRARAHSPAPFAPGIHEAVRKSLRRQLSFIDAVNN